MTGSLHNYVRALREAQGLSQVALAETSGISRQTLSAIEGGRSEPSAAIALRLSHALGRRFEEVFFSDDKQIVEAELEPGPEAEAGPFDQRLVLANLHGRWVGYELGGHAPGESFCAADGVVTGRARGQRARVEVLRTLAEVRDNVVLLGCAPALGLLADRVNQRSRDLRIVWLQRSSTDALNALERRRAHVAGVHFFDPETGQHNLPDVQRSLRKRRASLFALTRWEAGLVVARGNPLSFRSIHDLARPGLRLVAREPGAGARRLLEDKLKQARLPAKRILAGARIALGHFEVAQAVALGAADVGVAMRHAALAYGLAFVPLAEEHFDLVFPQESLEDPRITRLLDALTGAAFRRDLDSLGGYDASTCGARVAELGGA